MHHRTVSPVMGHGSLNLLLRCTGNICVFERQVQVESSAFVDHRSKRYITIVLLYDLLDVCQPDTRAFVTFGGEITVESSILYCLRHPVTIV